jgi:hypothetical protein
MPMASLLAWLKRTNQGGVQMARPKKEKKVKVAKKKLKVAKATPKKKIKVAVDASGPKPKKRGPGRPPSKKPVIGYEITNKDQDKIGAEFAKIQEQFDRIAGKVSEFAFEASPKSAIVAIKDIVSLNKNMNGLRRIIRTVKGNLKPKYGDITASA